MSSGNWWEFYFIRYFIGSVLGALIILAIALHPDSGVSSVISEYTNFKALEVKDITAPFLLSLLFLGAAFCYIASGPVLVLHSLRYRFRFERGLGSPIWFKVFFVLSFIAVYYAICISLDFDLLIGIMAIPAFLVIYGQCFLFLITYLNPNTKFFDYYQQLAKNRAKDNAARKEFVESYRHLREHGNAFLILLCEAALGLALFSCSSVNALVIVGLFWLIPTLPVWFMATYLESRVKDV
ncbi:hypothetical protein ACCF70_004490 [Vibrio parahaemolyticus]|uniref:hypothetical protein n=1 Tax=Vibrio parahaemolyticus TaxID=670 RepID=UPI00111CCD4F|nr:hypothetical protein [Vibrio parahaemolyticus]EGR1394102.1 hypothetical protein [Vibrio parahaemolyticus]EJM7155185.1 hypothetical protein [Vibrio parahaemolyticus]EJY0899116.1 hypothetical protein [Vibrio parahaemolyticus]EKO5233607.1 hypothetical protein [Vibrio parahaemolyticus]ELA7347809.1 hypothetical protein [Vibrio parahaemolyticus]